MDARDPPLRHMARNRVTDVHHTILPKTCRITPDADALIKSAVPVHLGGQNAQVLCPADMVVHAAIHTFYDGDLNERLRDILDLHELLVQFSAEPDFWRHLLERAERHEADRPVFYALWFAQHLFDTPVPATVYDGMDKPGNAVLRLMSWAVRHAALPILPEKMSLKVRAARRVLYMRSHWLRMPPLMLGKHLATKFLMSLGIIRQ